MIERSFCFFLFEVDNGLFSVNNVAYLEDFLFGSLFERTFLCADVDSGY